MRTSLELGAFILKPYGNQDVHYYYIVGDLPVNSNGYDFDHGKYDPETQAALRIWLNDCDR